ncbi:MAG: hypothetical protein M3Z26_16925 [Bacteroidota bacterium]|nr:hypothetical protein [Bacteroidota bacterium]
MKPYIKATVKTVFFIILLAFNKAEWILISVAVILLNIWLYPNFIIDVNIVRQWIEEVSMKKIEKFFYSPPLEGLGEA